MSAADFEAAGPWCNRVDRVFLVENLATATYEDVKKWKGVGCCLCIVNSEFLEISLSPIVV